LQGEGVWVAEVEAFALLGDDDDRFAVGGEVQVVRVVDGDGQAGFACSCLPVDCSAVLIWASVQ